MGWVIDEEKTKSPDNVSKEGEADLLCTPNITISTELNKDVFVSKLTYSVSITRSAFKYKKFKVPQFILLALPITIKTIAQVMKSKKDEGLAWAELGVAILGAINGGIKEKTIEKENEIIDCSICFRYDTKNNEAKIKLGKYNDTLDKIGYRKKHRYNLNMERALNLFKRDVEEAIK